MLSLQVAKSHLGASLIGIGIPIYWMGGIEDGALPVGLGVTTVVWASASSMPGGGGEGRGQGSGPEHPS